MNATQPGANSVDAAPEPECPPVGEPTTTTTTTTTPDVTIPVDNGCDPTPTTTDPGHDDPGHDDPGHDDPGHDDDPDHHGPGHDGDDDSDGGVGTGTGGRQRPRRVDTRWFGRTVQPAEHDR